MTDGPRYPKLFIGQISSRVHHRISLLALLLPPVTLQPPFLQVPTDVLHQRITWYNRNFALQADAFLRLFHDTASYFSSLTESFSTYLVA